MSRATSALAKINAALNRIGATDRTVYKRVITSTGGDHLTGRGSTSSRQDSALDPQPVVTIASKEYPLVIAGQALSPDAEYLVTVSASAMTRSEVYDPSVSIVFDDGAGVQEELFVVGVKPNFINNTDVTFDLVLSSKQR